MASQTTVVSHWSTLIENFQTSSLGFYKAVEDGLTRRQVPETKNSRVDYKEAGLLSANREYLRIRREKLIFDICAAPFGTGFFISWWLVEDLPTLGPAAKVLLAFLAIGLAGWLMISVGITGTIFFLGFLFLAVWVGGQMIADNEAFDDTVIMDVPVIGALYVWLFKPATYYRIDTMTMFQTAVHNSVLEVIDAMATEKGIRALAESERKPVMREFYRRAA